MGLESMGKILLILGGVIFAFGLVFLLAGRIPFLGRLPGDIAIEREGFSFHFPLVSSIVVSIVLTILVNLVFWLLRR
jgi:uncharacterized membrane-anchored protein